jgi:hypothetical protein
MGEDLLSRMFPEKELKLRRKDGRLKDPSEKAQLVNFTLNDNYNDTMQTVANRLTGGNKSKLLRLMIDTFDKRLKEVEEAEEIEKANDKPIELGL